ncbi:MAG: hypothetical protein WCS96_09335 [Victivallales bacterium]
MIINPKSSPANVRVISLRLLKRHIAQISEYEKTGYPHYDLPRMNHISKLANQSAHYKYNDNAKAFPCNIVLAIP